MKSKPSLLLRGFSLLELLAVVSVTLVLIAVSAPPLASLLESNNLSSSGQMIADQFTLARQLASVRNQAMEVRLIKLGEPPRYKAVQIWTASASGGMEAVGKMAKLPESIAISENADLSPLLAIPNMGTGTLHSGAASGKPYTAFKIHPSGYLEPVPNAANRSKCHLTVLSARFATADTAPANYIALQLNPDTGNTSIYRP